MDIIVLTRRAEDRFTQHSSAVAHKNTPRQLSCLTPQWPQTSDSIQTIPTIARRSGRVLTSAAARLLLQAALARNQEIRNQLRNINPTTAPLHMSIQTPGAELIQQVLQINQPVVPCPVLSVSQEFDEYKQQVANAPPARPSSTNTALLDEAPWGDSWTLYQQEDYPLQQDHNSSHVSNTPPLKYDRDTRDLSFSLHSDSQSREDQDEEVCQQMDHSLVLEQAMPPLIMQNFCVRTTEKKDVVKPTSLLLSGLQAKEGQGTESSQQMVDFSTLEGDTAPLRQASYETTPKEKEVRTQNDNNLAAIRDELNDQKANIIKLGSMMKELAEN